VETLQKNFQSHCDTILFRMFQNENVACLGQHDPDTHSVCEAAVESSDTETRRVELSFETSVPGGSILSQSEVRNKCFPGHEDFLKKWKYSI